MGKCKALILITIELNFMWQHSTTLFKKLNYLSTQFDCFGTKIIIKPIQSEILLKQAYSLSLFFKIEKRHCCTMRIGSIISLQKKFSEVIQSVEAL